MLEGTGTGKSGSSAMGRCVRLWEGSMLTLQMLVVLPLEIWLLLPLSHFPPGKEAANEW